MFYGYTSNVNSEVKPELLDNETKVFTILINSVHIKNFNSWLTLPLGVVLQTRWLNLAYFILALKSYSNTPLSPKKNNVGYM